MNNANASNAGQLSGKPGFFIGKCRNCQIDLKRRGSGSNNRALCQKCWTILLVRHRAYKKDRTSGDTMAVLALEYGVSVASIAQKSSAIFRRTKGI